MPHAAIQARRREVLRSCIRATSESRGEPYLGARAATELRLEPERPAELLDQRLAGGEPDPTPPLPRAGREEGLERAPQRRLVHPGTVVDDLDHDLVAFGNRVDLDRCARARAKRVVEEV